MYSSEHYYRLAKMRRDEILRDAEASRWLRSAEKKISPKLKPRVAWALVGPAFTVIMLSLFI